MMQPEPVHASPPPTDFAQEQLHNLYEKNAEYAIFTLDPKGYIRTWNPGAERMKQYTAEEAIGSHFSMLYPDDARDEGAPMDHLREAAQKGRYREQGPRRRKNGSIFLADVSISPMRASDGTLLGFSKVVADIDDQGGLQAAHDASLAEIDQLQVVGELRDRFVSALAHDLRNPLAAVKSALQILTRYEVSHEKLKSLVGLASRSLERMEKMIHDLLDVNRIQSGQGFPVHKTRAEVGELVDEALAESKSVFGDRFLVQASNSPIVEVDVSTLRRAIENLISNAVKYGASDRPISVEVQSDPKWVAISVHNWGNPIPESEQKTLFEQFRRSASADRSGKRGWGIGLTLVRGIVEAHGGTVSVDSSPERGTTFTIKIPR